MMEVRVSWGAFAACGDLMVSAQSRKPLNSDRLPAELSNLACGRYVAADRFAERV